MKTMTYPNPCRNYTTIEYNIKASGYQSHRVSLFNIDNSIILTRQLTKPADSFILPVKGLNPGIYLLRLEQDGKCLGINKLAVIQ